MIPYRLSNEIPWYPAAVSRALDAVLTALHRLGRGLRARRAARARARRIARSGRELAGASLHLLRDIGAPESLLARRRWQEALAALDAQRRAIDLRLRG